ncbi:hypothetical protein ACFOEE_12825 [Pseudoalteromonas fenneropenaei]|uniref:Bacteriocin n=1 Tax=Pseudoalteromonas fenneropenaei TaxID=1737459 RepID=A0ABV7CL67_9GAMM
MKIKLNKKKVKDLSWNKTFPADKTRVVAGGQGACSGNPQCVMDQQPGNDGDYSVCVTF